MSGFARTKKENEEGVHLKKEFSGAYRKNNNERKEQ